MKVVCKCGHKVTLSVQDRKKHWEEYASKCLCAECYAEKTGRGVDKNAVMVGDSCLIQ
jgi:hypothetical protein